MASHARYASLRARRENAMAARNRALEMVYRLPEGAARRVWAHAAVLRNDSSLRLRARIDSLVSAMQMGVG